MRKYTVGKVQNYHVCVRRNLKKNANGSRERLVCSKGKKIGRSNEVGRVKSRTRLQ